MRYYFQYYIKLKITEKTPKKRKSQTDVVLEYLKESRAERQELQEKKIKVLNFTNNLMERYVSFCEKKLKLDKGKFSDSF